MNDRQGERRNGDEYSGDDGYSIEGIKVRKCERLTGEATLGRASFAIQNRVYGAQAARAETIIVSLVAAGSTSEHNEVSILSARRALFRIVLKQSKVAPRVTYRQSWKNRLYA